MFLKKKRKYEKITEEQLRTVKRVQQIEAELKAAREDLHSVDDLAWYKYYSGTHGYFNFNDEYENVIRDYISEKIDKLDEEKQSLIRGDE